MACTTSTMVSSMSELHDDQTMRVGLLMEAVQAQQRLAEESLQRLQGHLRDLDTVVRQEVQHTLSEALSGLVAETEWTSRALRRLSRTADLRILAWTVTVTLVSVGVALSAMRWMLPSPAQIASLRAQRAALTVNIARLRASGAGIDLRRCGRRRRLCVRVDRRAPAYGTHGEYSLVEEN